MRLSERRRYRRLQAESVTGAVITAASREAARDVARVVRAASTAASASWRIRGPRQSGGTCDRPRWTQRSRRSPTPARLRAYCCLSSCHSPTARAYGSFTGGSRNPRDSRKRAVMRFARMPSRARRLGNLAVKPRGPLLASLTRRAALASRPLSVRRARASSRWMRSVTGSPPVRLGSLPSQLERR